MQQCSQLEILRFQTSMCRAVEAKFPFLSFLLISKLCLQIYSNSPGTVTALFDCSSLRQTLIFESYSGLQDTLKSVQTNTDAVWLKFKPVLNTVSLGFTCSRQPFNTLYAVSRSIHGYHEKNQPGFGRAPTFCCCLQQDPRCS
jgi:hypothetical protein